MKKNSVAIINSTAKIVSSPLSLLFVQAAIALSGNPEIMKYSGAIGVVQSDFKNFIRKILIDIQSCDEIDITNINNRENQYLITQTLREVYFENNKEKRERYRNLIFNSLSNTNIKHDEKKEHLITLSQISENEILILKQIMINKADKNGFVDCYDYWIVFENCKFFIKDKSIFQGYINHLEGLGLLNNFELNGGFGGGIDFYSITSKGISFFSFIKWPNLN